MKPEIKFSPESDIGDGYMAVTNAISLKDDERELKIFLKVARANEILRESMRTRRFFLQEIFFYDNVYPTITQFYCDKTGESLKLAPELYHTCADEKNEMIFMRV